MEAVWRMGGTNAASRARFAAELELAAAAAAANPAEVDTGLELFRPADPDTEGPGLAVVRTNNGLNLPLW